jgi:hypothetical protein
VDVVRLESVESPVVVVALQVDFVALQVDFVVLQVEFVDLLVELIDLLVEFVVPPVSGLVASLHR